MVGEFRKFIARGNVMDLAIGIIIGAAFATVVKSFVDDILMPPIGRATGGVNFSELYLNLSGNDYATRQAAL
ncbi:MAG TPA: MscL family protein, partial [Longimicrobium sp.]|nr:MscL family protein [Longimicrobium sp.]